MATPLPLLARLLKTPDLARIVPQLQPEVLHRVIQVCGLEDCAEVVALATPAQLTRILDADVWHSRAAGGNEEFDVERFGVWLQVLMESGAEVAAQKLMGLDIALVIAGLARHTEVFDRAAVASYTTLDGEQVPGRESNRPYAAEIGGYVIEARRPSAWDAIVELLMFLGAAQPGYFDRLMRECVRLSSGPREADGFHTLLQDRDQDMLDLVSDRDARRETRGYMTPAEARAFMLAARQVQIAAGLPPQSPIASAYFRTLTSTAPVEDNAPRESPGALPPASGDDAATHIEPDAMAAVVEILRDGGVLPPPPRALLEAADDTRLALIQDYVAAHPAGPEELAYLANAIIAGSSIQARPFTEQEAADAVMATCNLGLENWPRRWRDCDLVAAFQVGWTVLHRDVCVYTAKRLIGMIADIQCTDRDIQKELHVLRRELKKHVREGAPWRARNALDVILPLDAPSWAALLALTDECPVKHAAVRGTQSGVRAIASADFEFISENRQIASVREFLESLPSALTR